MLYTKEKTVVYSGALHDTTKPAACTEINNNLTVSEMPRNHDPTSKLNDLPIEASTKFMNI